ncbi:MAG: hypothetical protein JWN76_456, partial [Chitinophagaceae bacterium]|nr:hypothetical protein [Chitinophagaceae bacterium]
NSLNSIYVQMDISKETAKDFLIKFSDLLRYQLYECSSEKILLSKEIEYLRSYIELQKSRQEYDTIVDFVSDTCTENIMVSPLLLIPFIENAFKHVSNFRDKPNCIKVDLTIGNSLLLRVWNTKTGRSEQFTRNGIGLKNVKRRLDLLYGKNYELLIDDSAHTFLAELKLPLYEN